MAAASSNDAGPSRREGPAQAAAFKMVIWLILVTGSRNGMHDCTRCCQSAKLMLAIRYVMEEGASSLDVKCCSQMYLTIRRRGSSGKSRMKMGVLS